MGKKDLVLALNSSSLAYLLEKPVFLKKSDEKKMFELLEKKGSKEFCDFGAQIIKSSSDVKHLYVYLKGKLDSLNLKDDFVEKQARKIFEGMTFGFLFLKSPVLERYLGNKVDKKYDELFAKYSEFFDLENSIEKSMEFDEYDLLKYYVFLKDLLKQKKIEEEKFKSVMKIVRSNLLVTKGKQEVVGSLISEETQEKLEFERIFPKVKVEKI